MYQTFFNFQIYCQKSANQVPRVTASRRAEILQRILDFSSRQPRLLFHLVWKTFLNFTYCINDEQNTIMHQTFFNFQIYCQKRANQVPKVTALPIMAKFVANICKVVAQFGSIFRKTIQEVGSMSKLCKVCMMKLSKNQLNLVNQLLKLCYANTLSRIVL